MTDALGHLGYALIAAGMTAIAAGRTWGWPVRAAGEVVWIGLGVSLGLSSIVVWGVVFVLNDIAGFILWTSRAKA